MSELENIARHIVRHEEERQVEKIKLESEIKALEEVLEHGISTEFVEDEVIYIYSPKTAHDMREKLYENYKQLHAQLTIPKSIADEIEEKKLDDYGVFQTLAQKKHIISDPEPFCDLSDGFISWCDNNEKWWAIMNAYLAGKALGVDLVKVVEG